MTIVEIESLTKAFADVRNELADVVGVLNLQIENAKRKHLADIKRLVARCADKHGALKHGADSIAALSAPC